VVDRSWSTGRGRRRCSLVAIDKSPSPSWSIWPEGDAVQGALALRLCEGLANDGVAVRNKYFYESRNSLHETVGAVDLVATIGAVRAKDAGEIQALAVRLRPMLRELMHSR
jgi:hypothetical protein